MYYTKIIIEDCEEMPLNDAYQIVMGERWNFLEDGNGRTKYNQADSANEPWILNDSFEEIDAVASKEIWDTNWAGQAVFPAGQTYHALIKIWNTQAAAQGWVAAVQAHNLPGVTISYHGTTDPSI